MLCCYPQTDLRERTRGLLIYFPSIDLFPMSSYIATRWLVHNGGYRQKPLLLLNRFETLWFGRLYLVTKVSQNFTWTYQIWATIQCFKLWESAIMDQSVTFRKRVYIGACSRKSGRNAKSICGGWTTPYAIRESWLSMKHRTLLDRVPVDIDP